VALATLDDVKRILRASPPADIAKRVTIGDSSDDSISTADAQTYLDAAEDELKLTLGFTPKKTPFVTELVASLAACRIYMSVLIFTADGEVPEFIEVGVCTWANEKMDAVLKGKIVLQPETEGSGVPRIATLSSRVRPVFWEEHTLHDDWVALEHFKIVPDSFRMTTARDFTSLLTRDTDYELTEATGEIRRLSGGAISKGDAVYCSYLYVDEGTYYEEPESCDWKLR